MHIATPPATVTQTPVPHAVAQSLSIWHDLLQRNAMEELDPLLNDDIVFRSPVAFTPYPGRTAIKLVLKTVNTVFRDFSYHRTCFSEDGLSVVLEFSATVGDGEGKRIQGVDLIRFTPNGKISEFEVMVRPMTGLTVLAQHMKDKLAPHAHLLAGEG